MSLQPCQREDAVLAAALAVPRAPLPPELLAHLDTCESCRDLHLITSVLQDDQAAALTDVRVPSAGQVWWRAELRARQEAATVAARPITLATGIAAACLIGVLASVAGVLAWWLQASVATSATQLTSALVMPSGWAIPAGGRVLLWLVAGFLLLATPVVLYVAFREE